MLNLTELVGFGGGGAVVTATPTAVSTNAANQTTYTFSGLSVGAAADDRVVVLLIAGRRGSATPATVSSCTVAGSSATSAVSNSHTVSTTSETVSIQYVELPSGTTGDVVVTWSNSLTGCGVRVFALYGATATPTATSSADGTGSPMAASTTIATQQGAATLAVAGVLESAAVNYSWAGDLTELDEQDIDAEEHELLTAYAVGGGGTLSTTVTGSANTTHIALAVASWRPA